MSRPEKNTEKNTFTIRIGNFKAEYRAYETRAPQAYDSFGTISLHTHPEGSTDPRWVLIRVEHEDWQVGRYSSGMYTPVPFDATDLHLQGYSPSMEDFRDWITEKLYKRLLGTEK